MRLGKYRGTFLFNLMKNQLLARYFESLDPNIPVEIVYIISKRTTFTKALLGRYLSNIKFIGFTGFVIFCWISEWNFCFCVTLTYFQIALILPRNIALKYLWLKRLWILKVNCKTTCAVDDVRVTSCGYKLLKRLIYLYLYGHNIRQVVKLINKI